MRNLTVEYLRFGDPTGVLRLSDRYIRSVGTTQPTDEVSFGVPQENLTRAMALLDYGRFRSAGVGARDAAAVHSAAEWLLKRWELDMPLIDSTQVPIEGHNWQITKHGVSLVRIPARTFRRRYGQSAHRPEAPVFLTAPLQTVTLTHPILVSDREISVRQFQQMREDSTYDDNEKALHWTGIDPISSPTPAVARVGGSAASRSASAAPPR
jgi:hypothetical protein